MVEKCSYFSTFLWDLGEPISLVLCFVRHFHYFLLLNPRFSSAPAAPVRMVVHPNSSLPYA